MTSARGSRDADFFRRKSGCPGQRWLPLHPVGCNNSTAAAGGPDDAGEAAIQRRVRTNGTGRRAGLGAGKAANWGRRRARSRFDGGHRDMGVYTAMRALGVVVLGVLAHDAFKV